MENNQVEDAPVENTEQKDYEVHDWEEEPNIDNFAYPDDTSSDKSHSDESRNDDDRESTTDVSDIDTSIEEGVAGNDSGTAPMTDRFVDFLIDVVFPNKRKSLEGGGKLSFQDYQFKLRDAINTGNVEQVKLALNTTTGKISMALVMETMERSAYIGHMLLQSGRVEANEVFHSTMYNTKMTALEFLAMQSDKSKWSAQLGMAEVLINMGADVNAITEKESRPIYLAVKSGHFLMVNLFLNNNATLNPNPMVRDDVVSMLYNAVSGKHCFDMVRILDRHISVRMTSLLEKTNALHWLCDNKHFSNANEEVTLATFLLDRGVSLELQNHNGRSPLHQAVAIGDLPLTKLFLERGADVNQLSFVNSEFPLYLAASCPNATAMIDLLVEKGANVHKTTSNGKTALHNAAENNSLAGIRALLKYGADVNALDDFNQTPLVSLRKNNCKCCVQHATDHLINRILELLEASKSINPVNWEIVCEIHPGINRFNGTWTKKYPNVVYILSVLCFMFASFKTSMNSFIDFAENRLISKDLYYEPGLAIFCFLNYFTMLSFPISNSFIHAIKIILLVGFVHSFLAILIFGPFLGWRRRAQQNFNFKGKRCLKKKTQTG